MSFPHIHSFLWVLNPSNIEDNIDLSEKFVDSVISANIPSETEDPLLFELVQTYRIYSHSKPCKKYKNKSCSFKFGKFFTSETVIAQPIKNVSEFAQLSILEKKDSILSKDSEYINDYLDSSKKFYQPSTIKYVLSKLQISEKITIGYFQSQQILTIRFILKEEPIPVLLLVTIQCC